MRLILSVVSIIQVQSSVRQLLAIVVDVESGLISTQYCSAMRKRKVTEKKRLPLPTIDAQKVYVWYLEILIIYNNKSAFCLILYHRMQASTVYDFNNFAIMYNYTTFLPATFLNKSNVVKSRLD